MKKVLAIIGILCWLASGCYEDVEGCLDPNAANYDLEADIQCVESCCEFPTLSISIDHRYGDTSLSTDRFYVNANDEAFRITRLRYYWSDLALILEGGERLEPQDALEIGLVAMAGDTVLEEINDNLNLFRSGSTRARRIGTFRATEPVIGLVGQVGIEDDYQIVAPVTAPNDHPLGFQDGRLHLGLDTGYVHFKLEYDLIVGGDTIPRVVQALGNQPLNVDFGEPIIFRRGFDVTTNFTAAVDEWIAGLSLAAPEVELGEQLRERIVGIFRLDSILID